MKNKKGQAIFVGIMVAIMVFITVVVLITPLKDVVTTGRDNLNCEYTNLTAGERATCILVDMWLFYFVGSCIAAGIGFVTGKRIKDRMG